MKKIAVIGAKGNMGQRYCLILEKYCSCEVVKYDIDSVLTFDDLKKCDGFIIATPTDSHLNIIRVLQGFNKPILCEKPITKDVDSLKSLLESDIDLSMINQYEFLDDKNSIGITYYDYFKTGNDGLYWDCINIIGIARSSIILKNESLVWNCMLNGKKLDLREMDYAYIQNINEWVLGWRNKDYILGAHKKVVELYDKTTK